MSDPASPNAAPSQTDAAVQAVPQGQPAMTSGARLAAGIVACLTLLAVGWSGLLIPSLLRSIKVTFDQTDAGIGSVYLVYALAYAFGSFGGGPLTERLGRRVVLGAAVLLTAAGVAGLGLAPTWALFLVASVALGMGAGCLDGGANGLVLDVYREGRGRAMNLLHMSFSVGALAAPLLVGTLVDSGVTWQATVVGTGVVVSLLAIAYVAVPMPSARRSTRASRLERCAGGRQARRPIPARGAAAPAGACDRRLRRGRDRRVELDRRVPRAGAADDRDARALALLGGADGRPAGVVGDRGPVRPPALHDHLRPGHERDDRRRLAGPEPAARHRRVLRSRHRVGTHLPDDRRHRRRAVPGAVRGRRWIAHRHGRRRLDDLPARRWDSCR